MTDESTTPTETPNRWIRSPAGRRWLYGIAAAGLAVAGYYKLVDDNAIPLWLAVASNVLGLGALSTSIANVPDKP